MTITKAIKELRGRGALRPAAMGRIRRVGAGRKRIEESAPAVTQLIARIVEETTAGVPMSLLRWTSKSTRLARRGTSVKAVLDTGLYPKGIKVEWQAMRDVQLRRHTLHPDWNYRFSDVVMSNLFFSRP